MTIGLSGSASQLNAQVGVRAREQLMLGASPIKITAGGDVASPFSRLDVSTRSRRLRLRAENNLNVIMKDGTNYKDNLDQKFSG